MLVLAGALEPGSSTGPLFLISFAFGNLWDAETSIRGIGMRLGESCDLESEVEGLAGVE